jgi:hypothetical protein
MALCYACVGLGVHNADLFTLALFVMLTLVWVFTLQIYLSWIKEIRKQV